MLKFKLFSILVFTFTFLLLSLNFAHATPTTLIWSPSTDIQPWKKIHVTSDFYFPTYDKKDVNDNHLYVQQVYGITFSLLPDSSEKNPLSKIWEPLGKIMAETGFDYKKGFGSSLDTYPWYFNFKVGVAEDAYFKHMPAVAFGVYDVGTRHNLTDYDVVYFRAAKTLKVGDFSLGRFSAGYFQGNGRLLRNAAGKRDKQGVLLAWERVISEISDKLWVCVDYQGTKSGYGALNLGFSWKFNSYVSAILGFDMYNNRESTDTVTLQLDVDF